MPTIPTFYFDTDPTGVSISNKVTLERHITTGTQIKMIVPDFGPYFVESLKVYVYDELSNTSALLTKGSDYTCAEILSKETETTGKEICAFILVKPITATIFDISYQAYGGIDSPSGPILKEAFDSIDINSKTVPWVDIKNKPLLFTPGHHLHDSADLYGVEYISNELERLKQAIDVCDNVAQSAITIETSLLVQRINDKLDILYSGTSVNDLTHRLDIVSERINLVKTRLEYVQEKFNVANTLFKKAVAHHNLTI